MKIIFEITKKNLNFNFKKYEIIFSHNNKVTAFLCNMIFLKFKFLFFLYKKKKQLNLCTDAFLYH